MRLEGKVAIVTGGGSGIGRETVLRFVSEGAKVMIADIDYIGGEETLTMVEAKGGDALFQQVEVSKKQSVDDMVNTTINIFGKVDILINNAGVTNDKMLGAMTPRDWYSVVDVNLTGVLFCTQAVMPYMIEQGGGTIINASSIAGIYGNIGQTNYAATKAGIIGMTKTWAKELGSKGITVNAVAPGVIETNMISSIPAEVGNKMKEMIPLKRLGKPEDVANAYLFLASDEANFINGTVLHVDGGMVI
ncbi:3-oxoacyl-ACP reductase FabG [Anaerobacillus isosaccharinicus]|uniref:3-oxoacyl-ACP reductase FabG n=1 Tax=Anaerobacillus isosaccharinicus TaxID=1532552 RepID=A0A1S2M5N7_9BACI|nr:3-oxoacyl-ACP reductase FabG [Anaerobacillus isosaccharinicus]MBA5587747.1 3-oxoacyl-ACP reductase FabG [Anaerobacillus isosaccharinicus]QOY34093.1 3-oxoacyl-ACP reductase FabG [Anaerobacillus isosaccharinicus]